MGQWRANVYVLSGMIPKPTVNQLFSRLFHFRDFSKWDIFADIYEIEKNSFRDLACPVQYEVFLWRVSSRLLIGFDRPK